MDNLAIITGGAQGIGRALVQHFAGEGWAVAALDLDTEALEELTAAIPGERLLSVQADCGVEKDVAAAFAQISDWRGKNFAAHLLVNNSAIADPVSGPLESLSLSEWRRRIDASLTAAFLCSRAAIPHLRASDDNDGMTSSIVNIASIRAIQSEPDTEAYAASKGGLLALSHAMAISLGPDIRVNAVLPGWIETRPWQKQSERENVRHRKIDRQQHPAGRVGKPQDIVEAVAYLAKAGFVTGEQLIVDGGMTRKMIYAG